jgi:hypothetical protein
MTLSIFLQVPGQTTPADGLHVVGNAWEFTIEIHGTDR